MSHRCRSLLAATIDKYIEMKNLNLIAEELFNKVRGRFPSVTIGNQKGEVTNVPEEARFFDFDYMEGDNNLGKISVSLSDKSVSVMYSQDIVEGQDSFTREKWFNFLKELRVFAKKRLLNFDTRNITKSNLNKRDYKFLSQQGGDTQMSESKLYGTSRVSYQNIGNARLNIRHTESVNQELATGRTRKIGAIYIESADGERFKYPYKHLNGARAMAMHVSEGGKPYDDFGKHITGLSEELANLRKFKTYMNRSSVMAESLTGYMDIVKERIETVKHTVESLQKPAYYKEAFDTFEVPVLEEVPEDVKENWIDELTIRQFNEELSDVFPYIYKLVSEATRAKELTAEGVLDSLFGSEEELKAKDAFEKELANAIKQESGDMTLAGRVYAACNGDNIECLYSYAKQKGYLTPDMEAKAQEFGLEGEYNMELESSSPEAEMEKAFDAAMGQFNDKEKPQPKKPQVPVTEFVLSMYDRETGQFPKGETAVLTAVEKDYGEQYINPAKAFIEAINGYKDPELSEVDDAEIPFDGPYSDKKIAKAGKHGYGPSAAKHLAKQGMQSTNNDIEIRDLLNDYEERAYDDRMYGEPDNEKILQLISAGKIEAAAEEFVNSYTDQDGGEPHESDGMYADLVDDLKHILGSNESAEFDRMRALAGLL
jgi:hypothetical protein